MKSYNALKAQIDKLEKQAAAIRQKEVRRVISELKRTIAAYQLSAADLGLTGGARKKPARNARRTRAATVGVVKYRNPQTGATWTGRGRPPAWIAGAKDRDAFLIDAPGNGTKRQAVVPAERTSAAGKRSRQKGAASATPKTGA